MRRRTLAWARRPKPQARKPGHVAMPLGTRRVVDPASLAAVVAFGRNVWVKGLPARGLGKQRGTATVPDGLWVAAAGMLSRSAEIDVWAQDVANANTPTFRALLPTQVDAAPGTAYATSALAKRAAGASLSLTTPVGVLEGGGVSPGPTLIDTSEGPLTATGRVLDIAIDGPGFLMVQRAGGGIGYSRGGVFGLDGSGTIVDGQGMRLLGDTGQPIRVPSGATRVDVAPDGRVLASVAGRVVQVGRVVLSLPTAAQGMLPAAAGLWTATPAAGALVAVVPGTGGTGELVARTLEGSNVDLTTVLSDILAAQQAYAANSRAFSVGLALWTTANQILA